MMVVFSHLLYRKSEEEEEHLRPTGSLSLFHSIHFLKCIKASVYMQLQNCSVFPTPRDRERERGRTILGDNNSLSYFQLAGSDNENQLYLEQEWCGTPFYQITNMSFSRFYSSVLFIMVHKLSSMPAARIFGLSLFFLFSTQFLAPLYYPLYFIDLLTKTFSATIIKTYQIHYK